MAYTGKNPKFTSLKLATTDGTAAALNHYEEYSGSPSVTAPFSASVTLYIVRVGKMVTLHFSGIPNTEATSSSNITFTGAIPARFRPISSETVFIIKKGENLTSSGEVAQVTIFNTNGNFTIYESLGQNGFTSGTNYGIPAFSIAWQVA